jgi:RHS repeat-associated protein
MTRTVGGTAWTLSYDANGQLVSVTSANSSYQYTYDGDGRMVKKVATTAMGTHTTLYATNAVEITDPGAGGQLWKSYYFAGAQRIAVRTNGTISYLLGDHLGSTSLTVSPTGVKVADMQYKAWGETRSSTGDTPTDYQYTGQRNESGIGLYYYNARWYDASLGRFAQADTVIPGGVQGYDRYAYVNNSPMNGTDPSGHACQSYDLEGHITNVCGNLTQEIDIPASQGTPVGRGYSVPKPERPEAPISGFHIGVEGNAGIAAEAYGYIQLDILWNRSNGSIFTMFTHGTGGYLGTPNGIGGQVYVGRTVVHGIPQEANTEETRALLAGPNVDTEVEYGGDTMFSFGFHEGVSFDLNRTGRPQRTTAGLMWSEETSIGLGLGAVPTAIDVGVEVGTSQSDAWTVVLPWY